MPTIAVPDLSTAFIVAAVVPLILGFLVGTVIKQALKVGAAIAIIVLILIFIGVLTPTQVIQPILSAFKGSGPQVLTQAKRLSSYLPYSSITFLIGLAVGFYK
jgi:predicted metal-binding membrane protein